MTSNDPATLHKLTSPRHQHVCALIWKVFCNWSSHKVISRLKVGWWTSSINGFDCIELACVVLGTSSTTNQLLFLSLSYTQVHSFTTTLIDCTLAYGVKSKSDDAAAVRTFATQAPALAQAVVVMEEQCQKRCQSLVESRDFSIRRNTELEELQTGKIRNKGKPPEPPKPKKVCVWCVCMWLL